MTVTVRAPGDTRSSYVRNQPARGSERYIASAVWRHLEDHGERGAAVTTMVVSPFEIIIEVRLPTVLVGFLRRRRLTRELYEIAIASCPAGMTPTLRIVERWRRSITLE